MWINALSSVSSVTRRSSSRVPSAAAVTQSAPPRTIPRKRSPSKDPPVIGKIESLPCGVGPISSVAAVVRRRRISERAFIESSVSATRLELRLEQFMNGVDRTFIASVAARHRDEMVQECVRWVCGFEPRRRPKIVGCRIDRLATCQGLYHVWRTVTQAERPHRNESAVVGPQRGAKVQLENSIRSKEEPVGASTR